jgi:hypothetical protein
LLFLLLCLCVDLDEDELAAGALAEGPVDGASAAIAAVAIPRDNTAEAINLIMGSPTKGVDERCREYARSA